MSTIPRSESLISTDLFYITTGIYNYSVSLSGYCNTVNVIRVHDNYT